MHRPIMDLVRMHCERMPALRGLIHVPNEGKRTKAQHGMLIGLGMQPGVSDLLLLRPRRGYDGLAMELKAPGKIKTVTPEQLSFLRAQAHDGWLSCLCDDPEAGWALIRWYVEGERNWSGQHFRWQRPGLFVSSIRNAGMPIYGATFD